MGSVTSVIVMMLLLLAFLDNPFHAGVGGLKPVAMERSLRILDEALPSVAPGTVAPCDAAGHPLVSAGALHRPGRARRDGPARARDRCDGMERLPGEPLERRAGEGDGARQRRARRVDAAVRPREHARRRSTSRSSPSGSTRTRRDETELARLLLQALPPRVQARRRRLDRDEAAEEPERAADPVRDAAVHGSRRGTRPSSSRRRRTPGPRRRGGTSSARPTTCSASSCSPSALFFAGMSTKLPAQRSARRDARDRRRRLPRDARLDRDVPRQRLGLAGLEPVERGLDEPRQRLEVVAALEHGGDARPELCRAAGELARTPRSVTAISASGSSTWASKPAETSTSSGSKARDRRLDELVERARGTRRRPTPPGAAR